MFSLVFDLHQMPNIGNTPKLYNPAPKSLKVPSPTPKPEVP